VVLAEELHRATSLSEGLSTFQKRRFPRCRLVVESSVRLGQIEQTGGSKEEHADIMRQSAIALAAPF
jgi:hypothetical protein